MEEKNVIIISGEKYYPIDRPGDHCDQCCEVMHNICYEKFEKELCAIYGKDAYFVDEKTFLDLKANLKAKNNKRLDNNGNLQ